jgi:sugar phosphate isomerase/epimerase
MAIPVALQLYTVRDDADRDLIGTIRKVAQIGYKNVELAGTYGRSAAEFNTILKDHGLKAISAHVGIEGLLGPDVNKVIDEQLALGLTDIAVPYLDEKYRQGREGYENVGKKLAGVATLLKPHGIRLSYHNHNFEFEQKFDGVSGYEIIFASAPADLLMSELDTFWALFAGDDPVGVIGRHPGRFPLLHIKDMNPVDRTFAEVGTGILPLDGILAAAPAAGCQYLIVEQDSCKNPPLQAIETSYKNLAAKGYV